LSARLTPLCDVDEALVRDWRRLAQDALEPNPFADPDVVRPAARALGEQAAVALATVERDGRLCFALPVVRRRSYRRLPLPAVTTWLHDYSPLGTPLLTRDEPELVWREALGLFDSVAPVAALGMLATDGPVAGALSTALALDGRRGVTLGPGERPVVHRRPAPTYLDTLGRDRRKLLRRRRRQLAEALGGEVRCVDHATTDAGLEAAIERFLAMEADGWKRDDGGAMACRPGHADFFRDMCRRLAARGALQLWSLDVGGRPVAYQCMLLAGGTAFAFKTTYDEELRRFGPGVALMTEMLTPFHADPRLDAIDSCTSPRPTLMHEIFPDRRAVAEMLLWPAGRVGAAATWATPRVAAAYRWARHRRSAAVASQ
jgi:CelD/BcsL family acetyltransferase involved in cellulose biosynthesis